jgi:hypothetical protein
MDFGFRKVPAQLPTKLSPKARRGLSDSKSYNLLITGEMPFSRYSEGRSFVRLS